VGSRRWHGFCSAPTASLAPELIMLPTGRFFRSKKIIALAVIVLVLVGVRVALPTVIKHYANRTLDELEGYSGHITDVDLQLYRGAYQIEGISIVKTGGKQPVPFFSASELDLSVQWAALLDGAIVAEIDVRGRKVNFVTATEKPKQQQKQQEQVAPASNWTDVVKDLVPVSINRFSISNGAIHYRDASTEPKVNVYLQKLNAEARNLTNSEERSGSLVATFDGRATAMGSGRLKFKGRVDPYAKQPTFEADISLSKLDMRQLNPFLRAYANLDVERGTFSVDAEFAAKDGRFEGYVKPFMDKLDVLQWDKENEGFVNKIWQGVADLASELLEDQSRDRAAMRIPFKGSFDEPKADVWSAIGSLVRNAFVQALRRGLEGSVGIEKVSGMDPGKDAEKKDSSKDDSN
jgi:hypothetical protein